MPWSAARLGNADRAVALVQHRRIIADAMFESGQENGSRAVQKSCVAVERICIGGSHSAWVAQLVERVLGKDEVTGSIPVPGSSIGGFVVRRVR